MQKFEDYRHFPWLVKYTMVDYKHSISVLRLVCGPNFFRTKPAPKFGLVLRYAKSQPYYNSSAMTKINFGSLPDPLGSQGHSGWPPGVKLKLNQIKIFR